MFNRILKRPMFKRGGTVSTQGTGLMSIVEPRTGFKDGPSFTPADPLMGKVFSQDVNLPPLTREEIARNIYGGTTESRGPSKAELALLIGQVASTPGGIYEKMKASLPITSRILAGRREAEQKKQETIGTILTKSMLDERTARIKSGEAGPKLKRAEEIFKTATSGLQRIKGEDGKIFYRDPETGVSRTEDFYKDQALKQVDSPAGYEGFEARKQKLYDNMLKSDPYKNTFKKLSTAQKIAESAQSEYAKNRTKENEDALKLAKDNLTSLNNQLKEIESEYLISPLNREFPGVRVYKKSGGRIGFAEGSENPSMQIDETQVEINQPMAAQQPMMSTPQNITETPQEFKGLGYDEIRSSLPTSVSDAVVNLLATNVNALYDFANITDQDAMNSFNMKYNTDAVLPTQG